MDRDLCSGNHGYLGLFLTVVEYAQINLTPTPFLASNFPGLLTIDPLGISVEVVHAKEFYKENTQIYRDCKNVEKALLRHIQSALEEKYVEYLINKDIRRIE